MAGESTSSAALSLITNEINQNRVLLLKCTIVSSSIFHELFGSITYFSSDRFILLLSSPLLFFSFNCQFFSFFPSIFLPHEMINYQIEKFKSDKVVFS